MAEEKPTLKYELTAARHRYVAALEVNEPDGFYSCVSQPNICESSSREILKELESWVRSISKDRAKLIFNNIRSKVKVKPCNKNEFEIQSLANIGIRLFNIKCTGDTLMEKVILAVFERAGVGHFTCAGSSCFACDVVINEILSFYLFDKGKATAPEITPEAIPEADTQKTCKAHRLIHSNMLITNCNYKPIYYTDITTFCPYCGGRLDIIDI